ncbi:hypothetical protein KBD87_01200 [Candidatus Saccharibacteria bacterium]|nr:hypothetical protein [Candidatus Saccharibacteria bacterium]
MKKFLGIFAIVAATTVAVLIIQGLEVDLDLDSDVSKDRMGDIGDFDDLEDPDSPN